MGWKEFVGSYLSFTRRDRVGIAVVLVLMSLIILSPRFFPISRKSIITNIDSSWVHEIRKLEIKEPSSSNKQRNYNIPTTEPSYSSEYPGHDDNPDNKSELFYFDPNTLDRDGWTRLGVKDKTVNIIQNFLAKGGQFRKAEDLSRIYGISPNEFARLHPYIRIEKSFPSNSFQHSATQRNPNKKTPVPIDINLADTTAFIALPGIGSKLAARIITFREKLGGFYSVDQVRETFGLPDSTFQKIRPLLSLGNAPIKKININTATLEELKSHPYIRTAIAKSIFAYRNEHGLFTKVEDLKNVIAVTEEVFIKLENYMELK